MHTFDISRWAFTLADEPDAWAKGYDDSSWRTRHRAARLERRAGRSRQSHRAAPAICPAASAGIAPMSRCAISASSTGKHVRLVFHGVYKNADVWVNGYHVGGRPSGYAEFSFDLTEILSYATSDDLVVSVRVEHTDISDSPLVQRLGHHPPRRDRGARAGARAPSTAPSFTTLTADAAAATVRVVSDARQRHGHRPSTVRVQHDCGR